MYSGASHSLHFRSQTTVPMPNLKRADRKTVAEPAEEAALELFDPRRGDLPFRIDPLNSKTLRNPSRANYFSIFWIRNGTGIFHVDMHEHEFAGPALLFASPYQTLFVSSGKGISSARLNFHANFFCIETYHEEVGCNGVLFNDIYGEPIVSVPRERAEEVESLIALMHDEVETAGLAHSELLLSYLKVFLIKATRLKVQQQQCDSASRSTKPEVLARLVELIEINYREKHSPSEYAKLLGISEQALNRLVKTHFSTTLTLLIRERILKHAKWHLLHTRKPVKELAGELGFADELYFSRLFKRSTGFAPTAFREFETAIRGGRNLSM